MTTSLSRGMLSVRFLRLCSRAPPILMNCLLTNAAILRSNDLLTYHSASQTPRISFRNGSDREIFLEVHGIWGRLLGFWDLWKSDCRIWAKGPIRERS